MRKLGYLIPLLIVLTACGPSQEEPTPEFIPPEQPVVEAEIPPEEEAPEGLPGILFDAQAAAVGDRVGAWTIASIDRLPHAVGSDYSAQIAFEGSVLVEGTYTRHKGDELLGDLITFRPGEASAQAFPRMSVDERYIWFAFANQEAAEEILPSGDGGEVTIEVSAYTIHFAPSDVHNTAVIEAVR